MELEAVVSPGKSDLKGSWKGSVVAPKQRDMRILFRVTDANKPLMAVSKIADMGNMVVFGSDEGDYIENKKTGDRIDLRRQRGIYLLDGKFSDSEEKVAITVDSGAEDSVYPTWFGSQFGIDQDVERLEFLSASGGTIGHFGDRTVKVVSPF